VTRAFVADAIADGAVLEVPALWPLEVANALTGLVRRRKLTDEEHEIALGWLPFFRCASILRCRLWPFPGCRSWLSTFPHLRVARAALNCSC
jgi:hypothetical protein